MRNDEFENNSNMVRRRPSKRQRKKEMMKHLLPPLIAIVLIIIVITVALFSGMLDSLKYSSKKIYSPGSFDIICTGKCQLICCTIPLLF